MISAHVLVKNEDNFVWYSVMSVINYVDRIRLWDMGSTDYTKAIIDEIRKLPNLGEKIFFKECKSEKVFDEQSAREQMLYEHNLDYYGLVRQKMLDATVADWFLIVDGDEIWWDDSIKKVVSFVNRKGKDMDALVVPTVNLVGDMFHYQEKQAGRYHLAGHVGHYNLRAIRRNIPGLHYVKPHGTNGLADGKEIMVQDHGLEKVVYINAPYMHATHLQRSSGVGKDKEVYKRAFKRKHELGISFPRDFYYPEVFFRERPKIVPNIWKNMDFGFKFRAFFETPLRKINRRLLPEKVGY